MAESETALVTGMSNVLAHTFKHSQSNKMAKQKLHLVVQKLDSSQTKNAAREKSLGYGYSANADILAFNPKNLATNVTD